MGGPSVGMTPRSAYAIAGVSAQDAEGVVAVAGGAVLLELLEPLLTLGVAGHHAARHGRERVAIGHRRRFVDLAGHRRLDDRREPLGLGVHDALVALLERGHHLAAEQF